MLKVVGKDQTKSVEGGWKSGKKEKKKGGRKRKEGRMRAWTRKRGVEEDGRAFQGGQSYGATFDYEMIMQPTRAHGGGKKI